MDVRPKLQQKLETLFKRTPHVYHQPPASVKLEYPCIVYKMTGIPGRHADNLRYFENREYQLTVIDTDPDSKLREKVMNLKWCRFIRSYVSDNLYHFVFELKYQGGNIQ